MGKRNGSRGVTLAELCFGVAIVAILAGLSVPSMRAALRSSAVRSATLELLAGLQQARTSAIVAARPATLCLSDAAGRCLQGHASAAAWQAFLRGGPREQMLVQRDLPADLVLHATRSRLDFSADSPAASTATLTICDLQRIARPRAIIISRTGRVRLADATAGSCDA